MTLMNLIQKWLPWIIVIIVIVVIVFRAIEYLEGGEKKWLDKMMKMKKILMKMIKKQ